MQDSIYVAEGVNAHGETTRAIEISLLGIDPREPSTFLPDKGSDFALSWKKWIDKWFVPILAPRFVEIYEFASNYKINEAALVNQDLDEKLTDPLRTRSLKATTCFLEGKSDMKHHREWSRFSSKIEENQTPGHVLSLVALQTVLYHLGAIPALTAYAWFEFQSGLTGAGIENAKENTDVFMEIEPHLQLAVPREIGDDDSGNGKGFGQLRAI